MSEPELSKEPTPDPAEENAYFPSPYSLSQYTSPKTDFDGVRYDGAYAGGRWKILMIGTDERYLLLDNGKMFSTGNHPVETLLPLHHLLAAGFDVDVATVSGNPVKLEMWAMPREDAAVMSTYEQLKPKFKQPRRLADVIAEDLGPDSDYLAVFIPGGHGAEAGIPFSPEVGAVLDWALAADRFVITLCHGPAALLAASIGKDESPFAGYRTCVFPDDLDQGANIDIGYLPGGLRMFIGKALQEAGLQIVNQKMTGQIEQDRKLLTGDSPLASNALGLLAAAELLKAVDAV